jgi:hypothetical protein
MTRWRFTVLQIREVLDQESPAKVRAALNRVFSNLEEAYEKMVSRVPDEGLKLLHWVLLAMSPLTLEQLRFAYVIEMGMKDLDPKQDLLFPSLINNMTLGLLVADSEWNTVRFANSTMKDYLAKHISRYFPDGHSLLARTCLTFLNFRDLSDESHHARYLSHEDLRPFFEYAAFQWGNHVREAGDDKETCDMAVRWLQSEQMRQVHIIRKQIRPHDFLSYAHLRSPLYEACYFGLSSHVAKLLKSGEDVNSLDSDNRGPLYCAVYQNRLAVIQRLFKCWNLDINVQTNDGITPLHAASRFGHMDIVQLFLTLPRIKIPPSRIPSFFRFFLRFFPGLFLPSSWTRTVEINVQDKNGWTALISAAKSGYTGIVDLLLQHPDIDINVQDTHKWTALTWAVDGGHAETVRRLLDNKNIDLAASRVGEVRYSESLHAFAQGKHMSLPSDLRLQLGMVTRHGS